MSESRNLEDEELPKALAKGYDTAPFFFKERGEGYTRFVAWTGDLTQLRALVSRIVRGFPDEVEILLKVRKDWEGEGPEWDRYHGYCSRLRLHDVIFSNEEYVFRDGGNQLCVKDPATEEHIALDDHGILFIYSDSDEHAEILRACGYAHGRERLLSDSPHWHRQAGDADEQLRSFVRQLDLESVDRR